MSAVSTPVRPADRSIFGMPQRLDTPVAAEPGKKEAAFVEGANADKAVTQAEAAIDAPKDAQGKLDTIVADLAAAEGGARGCGGYQDRAADSALLKTKARIRMPRREVGWTTVNGTDSSVNGRAAAATMLFSAGAGVMATGILGETPLHHVKNAATARC